MTPREPKTFFMVAGDGPTNYRHETYEQADREAERLASQNPGSTFYVMQAIEAYQKTAVQKTRLVSADDFIPF